MKQRRVTRNDIQHLLEIPFRKLGHALAKVVFSPKKAEYPFPVIPGSKILFLRHDVLGDMITTLPLFRLVKRNFPEAEIHVVCTKSNSAILTYCDAVDHIHVVSPNILTAPHLHLSEIRAIRSLDIDIIVNCYTARTSKNGILIRLLSGPNTISSTVYAGERYASYFSAQSTLASSMISMWDKMFMLGVETFGLTYSDEERDPWLPALEQHTQSARQTINELGLKEKNFIAVNLSVGQERNIWPIQSYKIYLGYLLENGFNPLLFGMPKEQSLIESIQSEFPTISHYPFGRELQEIGMVLSMAGCAMSPDTGFVHLATSVGCPIILLDQQRPKVVADEWSPFRVNHVRVESTTSIVADIQIIDVIHATQMLMQANKS
jgi:ADP-heptose:LPS heptosyltransferase